MLEAPLFTATGAPAKTGVALPAEYFDGTVHEPVLHQAVTIYLANQRQGTAATKTRRMVSGGNQKPWRQKGTGRARQGTIRAPQWRGGGIVFGPSPRDYRAGIPVKVRRLARRSALNARAREAALYVIEPLGFEAPKTRQLMELLARLGLEGRKTLLLTDGVNRNVYLSGRNLPRTQVLPFADATAYDVLWSDVVVVEQTVFGGADQTGSGRTEADEREPEEGGPGPSEAGARPRTARARPATAGKKREASKVSGAKKRAKSTSGRSRPASSAKKHAGSQKKKKKETD